MNDILQKLEGLEAEVERLKAENKELRERIDWGQRRPKTAAELAESWKKKLEDEASYAREISKTFV